MTKSIRSFILLLLLLQSDIVSAQIQGIRTFYIIYSTTAPTNYGFYDTLDIISSSADTTWFRVVSPNHAAKNAFYKKAGRKVFNSDGECLFDFNLSLGNIFAVNQLSRIDSFIVDSVFTKTYGSRTFNALRLHKVDPDHLVTLEWVEGLGESAFGWNYTLYDQVDAVPYLSAICLDDSVIYWDAPAFKPETPIANCDFAALEKMLSVEALPAHSMRLYPIPAGKTLTIGFDTESTGFLRVYNSLGQMLIEEYIQSAYDLDLALPDSGSGLLFVNFSGHGINLTRAVATVR